MLSDEEKAVLKIAKENYGLTSAEQKILINLIEKQSKEIEELKEGFKIQEHNYQVAMEEIEQRWEDKIKAKIEEVDKMKSNGKYTILFNSDNVMEVVKAVLQSLLEKE